MYLVYIFILYVTPFVTVHARSVETRFSVLPTFTAVLEGISDLASFLSNIYDIFNILSNDNITEIHGNLSIFVPEDAYLNVTQLANKYGYPFEEHPVVTDDGYILNIHRIPHGRNGEKNNLIVFLMHGILDASDSWVIQGPERALSYVLADEGFDVWMGNTRGNKHAPKHMKYNSSQPEFWRYTWEEIGIYDIPKMIDYILELTGKESLYYIGNSQGTTTFYVMNSLRPEYNKKIKMMFSLAPVAWMSHVRSPMLRFIAAACSTSGHYLSGLNTYVPSPKFFNKVAAYVCSASGTKCKNSLESIAGNEYRSINESVLPIMLGHMFSGTSILQFIHYGQLVSSGRFCRYDHGPEENNKLYGESTPPDYNLTRITAPVGLFYSDNDWLSDLHDVELLRKHLPNVFLNENIEGYIHLDYIYAHDVKEKIFSKIITHIQNFEQKGKVHANV